MKCFGNYCKGMLRCHFCNAFIKAKCYSYSKNKEMETKEVKIEIPEGYEIDHEHSSFNKIAFKKKENELPKSWTEFARLQENDTFHRGCEIINYNVYSSVFVPDKYAKAIASLNKLIRLRDYYNEEWKPNWENPCETKYVITTYCNAFSFRYDDCKNVILAFKSDKLRDEFYNNFKDLIEQAKELI